MDTIGNKAESLGLIKTRFNWNEAPEWATCAGMLNRSEVWFNDARYKYCGGPVSDREYGLAESNIIGDLELVEKRPLSEPCEVDDFTKQPRYKGDDGLDWIDEFARDNSIEDFRAAMRFTIGKYEKRLGKKDARSKELYKIADYYKRWSDIERAIELEGE